MAISHVPRRTNHLLHLLLSFATCGAWLLVWPCVWAYNKLTHDTVRTYEDPPRYHAGQYPGPYGR